jgi:hypothetical protein
MFCIRKDPVKIRVAIPAADPLDNVILICARFWLCVLEEVPLPALTA